MGFWGQKGDIYEWAWYLTSCKGIPVYLLEIGELGIKAWKFTHETLEVSLGNKKRSKRWNRTGEMDLNR